MSRTDKDTPWYARADWWEPEHVACQYATHRVYGFYDVRECDLPAEPSVQQYLGQRRRWRTRTATCHWYPVTHQRPYTMPPRWYIGHVWTRKERQAARIAGQRAAAEYRATGQVDTIPSTAQHRHCAKWLWW